MIEDITPPFDHDAEVAVLGSILIDPDCFLVIRGMLTPEDFYRDRNQWVFTACENLYQQKKAIDEITVAHELKRMKRLNDMGGVDFLSSLVSESPTSVYAEAYAKIIKDLSNYRELLIIAEQASVVAQESPPDVGDAIAAIREKIDNLGKRTHTAGEFIPISEVIMDSSERILGRMDQKFLRGQSCGFPRIDQSIGGCAGGNLIIIGARPGMGKTQLMCTFAKCMGKPDGKAAIVSLEMKKEEIADRFMYAEARLNERELQKKFSRGQVEMGELEAYQDRIMQALDAVYEYDVVITDQGRQTAAAIRSSVMRQVAKEPIGSLFVDHIRLVADKDKDEVRRLGKIAQELREIGRELDIPVFLLCQLNRKLEDRPLHASKGHLDKRPVLSDIRASGEIEEDADIVLGLYREICYDSEYKYPNKMEVRYLKCRQGAAGGNWSYLDYEAETGVMKQWSNEEEEE